MILWNLAGFIGSSRPLLDHRQNTGGRQVVSGGKKFVVERVVASACVWDFRGWMEGQKAVVGWGVSGRVEG